MPRRAITVTIERIAAIDFAERVDATLAESSSAKRNARREIEIRNLNNKY